MKTKCILAAAFCATAGVAPAAKPVALMGYVTDVKAIETDVVFPARYVVESFAGKWIDPADYGRYAVIYVGEKLRGEAKGKNWRAGPARAALEKFIAGGGLVIVGGRGAMNELFGKPRKANPDPLRAKVTYVERCLGRMKAVYRKAGKPLSFPDEDGNDVLTDEGRVVKAIRDEYAAAFAKAKDAEKLPEGEKWVNEPLGGAGTLDLPKRFPRRPVLGKPKARGDGLVVRGDGAKAVIALGDCGAAVRRLADELAWHLGEMCGETFDVVDGEPAGGPALVYRRLAPPKDFPRGTAAYFKIWRDGGKVFLGGEDAGLSRATTYVLEALGCRYLWPGASGKIIPRRDRLVLPEIAVEDATPLVVRRVRLYGWPVHPDRKGNRGFWQWHGLNDTGFMTSERPRPADVYQWGHYYGSYYTEFRDTKPEFFALQPDGTRTLRLGGSTGRPTFCLSNRELADVTAARKIKELTDNPRKKAVSLCLPDGATASWCLCEACRRMDPVNAAKGSLAVFFPERRRVPYVALTDRVFEFMNRVAAKVAEVHPDRLLSTYAYSCYTAAPVKTVPHRNLLVLSVAGNYSNAANYGTVEPNLAAWASFGNKVMWRPNAHGGYYIAAPDNFARHMFADISLLAENGIFGVDYDTMYSEWATKGFLYYITAKAHFNPDRLDYDSFADDYCRAGFGAAAAEVRAYFDDLERAHEVAAKANQADKEPTLGWAQRVKRQNRILEALDFDALDARLAKATAAAAGDEGVLARIDRLRFGNELGRFTARRRLGRPSKLTKEEEAASLKAFNERLARDPAAFNSERIMR